MNSNVTIEEDIVCQKKKKAFLKRLVSGLTKTRDNIVAGFDSIFSGYSSIDEDFYEELEEILIMGDIGINATSAIIEHLKEQVAEKHIKNLWNANSF